MMEIPRLVSDKAYSLYENDLEKHVREGEMPKHIAIIMDGNRRYAVEVLDAEPNEGHRLGKEKLKEVVHWCLNLNIKCLTLYAFSVENFNREKSEVDHIMDLLEQSLYELAEDGEVHKFRMGFKVIGDMSLLPENIIKAKEYAEERTKDYHDFMMTMAIAYGGRQDITNAVRQISERVRDGELDIDDIDEDLVSSYISTSDVPDPDLILRTSGEIRVSNFLLWQMAYSEFYFTDVYWPGFRYIDLLRAIRTYQQRKRRFGK